MHVVNSFDELPLDDATKLNFFVQSICREYKKRNTDYKGSTVHCVFDKDGVFRGTEYPCHNFVVGCMGSTKHLFNAFTTKLALRLLSLLTTSYHPSHHTPSFGRVTTSLSFEIKSLVDQSLFTGTIFQKNLWTSFVISLFAQGCRQGGVCLQYGSIL